MPRLAIDSKYAYLYVLKTVDPTVNDDLSKGYAKGQLWVTTTKTPPAVYSLVDNRKGAAIWTQAYGSPGLTYDGSSVAPLVNSTYLTRESADTLYRGKSTYIHTQGVPSDTWVIVHNLGSHPIPIVFDSAGTQIEGDSTYLDNNTLQITFAFGFSGVAYLA